MQCLSRLIGGGNLKLLGHEWVLAGDEMRDLKGLWRFPGDFLQTFSNGSSQRALINKCAYWGHLTAKSCETSTNGLDRSESAAAPSSQREAFAVTARSRARLGGLATPCSYWLPLC